ncbi:transcriptional regulator [Streptomyces albus]|uniref:Transcriptional regulator n=1 Tax=Streptomyces albus (strain ATCC 21838 / DSM 41398 / FERM P-419 / JCM 4703 / NBRC 107858) TaxID=1081613 RepID=A0A0B5F7U8_STRA4|nr:transcriptional regulator [Streptomyces albus]AOU81945.1 transcriptional regulator [Streptomyces albus]AYN37630.1 MarR family transcriptional regulator [Streptomyces albus]
MPPAATEPAPEQLAAELTEVMRLLVRRLRGEARDSGLTPSQRSVMARLDAEGPATTAALARAEFVRPQSMRGTLAAMEEQGLVGRRSDPDDARQSVLFLTEEGQRVLASVRAAKHEWLTAALTEELGPRERRTVAEASRLLARLVRH